jgi:hypothetical protein
MDKHIFEIHNDDDKLLYISWVLNIPDEVYDKGKDFLILNDNSFEILWSLFDNLAQFTIVTEDHYVDRVYRDSYYFYYSCKHFNYNRYCKRIFLFDGFFEDDFINIPSETLETIFIGSIVIRPINNRSIGRTLLNPSYFLNKLPCYLRLTLYNVTVYGKKLSISAFPYSMQDGETTSCAEITILNLLDYYSQTYPEYHYILPSEICKIAELNSYERRLPTVGLRYELLSKIFSEVGFYPRLYSSQKMHNLKFKRIMHYYIESGIPIALGIKVDSQNKHSIIGIGHGNLELSRLSSTINSIIDSYSGNVIWVCDVADIVDDYIIMDDNLPPYTICNCVERESTYNEITQKTLNLNSYEVEYMMVPLYKRMFLEAADAYDICMSILAHSELGIKNFIPEIGSKDNPIVIRLFMASSRTLRKTRHSQFYSTNKEAAYHYNEAIFPKFVWVCELYTITEYPQQSIGEIIIDATSSPEAKTDSFIIIHYPNTICKRLPDSLQNHEAINFETLENWTPFMPFNGNLNPYS